MLASSVAIVLVDNTYFWAGRARPRRRQPARRAPRAARFRAPARAGGRWALVAWWRAPSARPSHGRARACWLLLAAQCGRDGVLVLAYYTLNVTDCNLVR